MEIFKEFINHQKENEYEKHTNLDLDASIYEQGIFSNEELASTHIFHSSNTARRIEFLESADSPRIKKLGMRVIFRNFPSELNEAQKDIIKNDIINA